MSSDDLFEAISHPLRVEIIKLLAKGPRRFADIKRELRIKSGGLLDFHLKKLDNLISINDEGFYVLNEKGFAALQALEVISKYGWQKRAFYLNLLICIIFNIYFALTDPKWLLVVLVISTSWMIFYSYWTFVKRHVTLKNKFER
ncbi:MAG: helix-turn-helix domain-containing protein [Candidatus Methanomethylicia archaeon]